MAHEMTGQGGARGRVERGLQPPLWHVKQASNALLNAKCSTFFLVAHSLTRWLITPSFPKMLDPPLYEQLQESYQAIRLVWMSHWLLPHFLPSKLFSFFFLYSSNFLCGGVNKLQIKMHSLIAYSRIKIIIYYKKKVKN